MKKNLLLLVTITILSTLLPNNLKAFNGYEVSFNHISGRTYEFNLEFYNITGTPPNSVEFDVYSTCGIAGRFSILNQNNTTILAQSCSLNTTQMSKTSFSGSFTFPTNGCSDFLLVLDINTYGNYVNISNSGNNSGILINGVGLYSNSSPKIINTPKYLSINNQISSYNLHAIDPDGDSLVYKLAQPPGNFQTGFSINSPFGINQSCTLDSKTGILKAGMASYPLLLSVEIEEYRKQVLISTTHRVWTLYKSNNTTTAVSISEINYNQGYDTTFCVPDSVFFEFKAASGINPAIVEIDSNKYGATITTLNGISYFSLSQNSLLKTNTPYHFYVNATSGCDINTQLFTIRFDSCITTSIQELEFTNFNIFPNPSQGRFTINFNNEIINSTISVRSITGQLMNEFQVNNPQQDIDISELESGIYFISIPTKAGTVSKKIILSK